MPVLIKASAKLIEEEISQFPIFVIHKNEVQDIGLQIVNMVEVYGNWSVNVSTMEEFISKGIITKEKIDSFKTIYKTPKKFLCLFTLSEFGAEFIFLPKSNIKK